MTVTSQLKRLKRQLEDLQKPRTLHDLHNLAGRDTFDLVMEGFQQETDPYGRAWKPTKRRNPILQDKLNLRDGIKWKADGRRIEIKTTGPANEYAAYHQNGTQARTQPVKKNGQFRSRRSTSRLKTSVRIVHIPALPARKFFPDEGTLPPAYEARIRNTFEQYLRQKFGAP